MIKKYYTIVIIMTLISVLVLNVLHPVSFLSKMQLAYFMFSHIVVSLISVLLIVIYAPKCKQTMKEAIIINIPLVLTLLILITCCDISIVVSGSMESTVMTNSLVFSLQKNLADDIERGDIILFYHEDYSERLLKRVIGMPGDTVRILAGKVYVNGEMLDESYLTEPMCPYDIGISASTYIKKEYEQAVPEYLKDNEGNTIEWLIKDNEGNTYQIKHLRLMDWEYKVPEGKYFVMGDNRNQSMDSRFWEKHWIDEEDIYAKTYFVFLPKLKIVEE